MKLVELLSSAIRERYSNDQIRAGLVISDLGDGTWYVSIARYQSHVKQIVTSAKGDSLEEALVKVARAFMPGDAETKLKNYTKREYKGRFE